MKSHKTEYIDVAGIKGSPLVKLDIGEPESYLYISRMGILCSSFLKDGSSKYWDCDIIGVTKEGWLNKYM